MRKLIEAIQEQSDFLIATVVFDIMLVGYWDMATRIIGGWSTIFGSNGPRGSAGIYFGVFVVVTLVVNILFIYRVVNSYRQSRIID